MHGSRSPPGWTAITGSDRTPLLATQHQRRSLLNRISNDLLRYALRAPLRSPLLQPRSRATKRFGSSPSWWKAGGHISVNLIVLLVLSDVGRPAYDQEHARAIAVLDSSVFACTPDQFPDLMATALAKQDTAAWEAGQGINLIRAS